MAKPVVELAAGIAGTDSTYGYIAARPPITECDVLKFETAVGHKLRTVNFEMSDSETEIIIRQTNGLIDETMTKLVRTLKNVLEDNRYLVIAPAQIVSVGSESSLFDIKHTPTSQNTTNV